VESTYLDSFMAYLDGVRGLVDLLWIDSFFLRQRQTAFQSFSFSHPTILLTSSGPRP
jgi:hypothetical protein